MFGVLLLMLCFWRSDCIKKNYVVCKDSDFTFPWTFGEKERFEIWRDGKTKIKLNGSQAIISKAVVKDAGLYELKSSTIQEPINLDVLQDCSSMLLHLPEQNIWRDAINGSTVSVDVPGVINFLHRKERNALVNMRFAVDGGHDVEMTNGTTYWIGAWSITRAGTFTARFHMDAPTWSLTIHLNATGGHVTPMPDRSGLHKLQEALSGRHDGQAFSASDVVTYVLLTLCTTLLLVLITLIALCLRKMKTWRTSKEESSTCLDTIESCENDIGAPLTNTKL